MPDILQIDSQPYNSYATADMADTYLAAASNGATWFTLTDNQKAQYLVTASRLFDRQCWLGTRTEDDQDMEWPRSSTGVTGVEDDEVPLRVIEGTIEMALALADGSEALSDAVPGAQKLSSISAGSVSLSYFRGAEGGVATAARFPLVVQEYIKPYLCGSRNVIGGVIPSGTDGESVTENDFGYSDGL